MKSNLIKHRKKTIENLSELILKHADGINIVGDGKNLVREAETLEVISDFTNGVYMRRMDVQKGTIIMGAVHKESHSWFLMHGVVHVADAEDVNYFKAPYYTTSQPGTQRVIEVIEDAVWVNIHSNPDNGQDLDVIEKRLFSLSGKEYRDYLNKKTNICQE
tara:strand:+ start:16041 stop:16523 length:483 start_codon:yes stop_codon:yes gene_type:complete